MPDIFLSYNREDQARAKVFAEAFEREGFSVWWDVGLKTGEAYDEVTETALRTAKAVVVLWSKRSVQSRWVRAEATLADRGKTLLPCMIEPCERPIMFELTQTAELSHWRGEVDDRLWLAFLTDLRRFVARDGSGAAATPAPAQASTPGMASGHDARASLAVLPFINMSNDPEQVYFADGMMQEITTALSRIRSIFVIASASTRAVAERTGDPQSIARQLGVRYSLGGSIRKSGDRIRIAVDLVDAAEGTQVWSNRYDGVIDDVFDLQDRVALSVAGVIEPTVREAELRRAARRPTTDVSGYDLYLKAMQLIDTYEKAPMFEAIGLLERAIALDPKYAQAMSIASYAHSQIVVSQWAEDVELHRAAALDLGRRAVKLGWDDADVLSWVAAGNIPLEQEVEPSIALVDRSITLNPGSAQAWMISGWLRMSAGKDALAIEHVETSMRLDPCSPDRGYQLGAIAFARFGMGQFDEAARLLKEVIQLQPAISMNLALLTSCHGHLGQAEAVRSAIARYRQMSSIDMRERLQLYRDPAQRRMYLDGIELAETLASGAR